jgi:hypothetical protein
MYNYTYIHYIVFPYNIITTDCMSKIITSLFLAFGIIFPD